MLFRNFFNVLENKLWFSNDEIFDPSCIKNEEIKISLYLSEIEDEEILKELKSELQIFKSLGYRFQSFQELEKIEYHSYQIGILLQSLVLNFDLKIVDKTEYFPDFIYKLKYTHIQKQVMHIVEKYNKQVSKIYTKEDLRKHIIWTPMEAGYLLYYFSFYNNCSEQAQEK
jgi:hypothetical protein